MCSMQHHLLNMLLTESKMRYIKLQEISEKFPKSDSGHLWAIPK